MQLGEPATGCRKPPPARLARLAVVLTLASLALRSLRRRASATARPLSVPPPSTAPTDDSRRARRPRADGPPESLRASFPLILSSLARVARCGRYRIRAPARSPVTLALTAMGCPPRRGGVISAKRGIGRCRISRGRAYATTYLILSKTNTSDKQNTYIHGARGMQYEDGTDVMRLRGEKSPEEAGGRAVLECLERPYGTERIPGAWPLR